MIWIYKEREVPKRPWPTSGLTLLYFVININRRTGWKLLEACPIPRLLNDEKLFSKNNEKCFSKNHEKCFSKNHEKCFSKNHEKICRYQKVIISHQKKSIKTFWLLYMQFWNSCNSENMCICIFVSFHVFVVKISNSTNLCTSSTGQVFKCRIICSQLIGRCAGWWLQSS